MPEGRTYHVESGDGSAGRGNGVSTNVATNVRQLEPNWRMAQKARGAPTGSVSGLWRLGGCETVAISHLTAPLFAPSKLPPVGDVCPQHVEPNGVRYTRDAPVSDPIAWSMSTPPPAIIRSETPPIPTTSTCATAEYSSRWRRRRSSRWCWTRKGRRRCSCPRAEVPLATVCATLPTTCPGCNFLTDPRYDRRAQRATARRRLRSADGGGSVSSSISTFDETFTIEPRDRDGTCLRSLEGPL